MKNENNKLKEIDVTDLISQIEASKLRETSRAAISDLIKRDRLQIYKVGGKKFLSRREVLSFESQQGRQIEQAGK